MKTRVCDMLGIEVPIFGFAYCKEVVAEISNAGGFGVLGAVRFTPEELEAELQWLDKNTDGKPYGVDVVMPAAYAGADISELADMASQLEKLIPEEHRAYVEEVLSKYDVPKLPPDVEPTRELLSWTHQGVRPQVDMILDHPLVKMLVNALGTPPPDVVEKCHAHGVKVAALVGSAEHARRHVEAGLDIVIASGYEAGGHTGEITTFVLVPQVVDAVAPTPVLAAGGIGDGRQVAAALALGADGAWTGSIWLTTQESITDPIVKQKLLEATSRDTVRSRSLSGKPARQLKTAWTEAWDGPDSPGTLSLPLQFMLTADAIQRMNYFAGDKSTRARDLVGSPVGQVVGMMNESRTCRDVIASLVSECEGAMSRAQEALAPRVS